jgi:uncharacterized protein YecE (DUF72 family)
MSSGIIRVGISGWTYAPWRGVFYPRTVLRQHELDYAATRFRCLEATATFYAFLRPDIFREWAEQVPTEFVFALQGPRLITHVLRLQEVRVPLANFIASGLLRLGLHLGPILWRLPSNLRFEPSRIEAFLGLLPHSTEAAIALGRQHDRSLPAPAWLQTDAQRPIRHAIEVRHESFRCAAFVDMLRANDVALVCADAPGARMMDLTSDFVYCRFLGKPETAYPAGYDTPALERWAGRLKAWAAGGEPPDVERISGKGRPRRRDVFVFFDNALRLRAPANALELIRRLRS